MANRFRMTAKWTGQPERRCPANVDLELYPSLRCSVRTLSESFWRQGQNETQTPLNPGSKHQSRVVASRPNVHEASQRAARKIHGPGVRLRERPMVTVRPRAYDKVLAHNPAAHMTVDHECQPAEHLLFLERVFAAYQGADLFCQTLIK